LVALQLRTIDGPVATFDLVAVKPITAGALALQLPLDGVHAGSRDGSARVVLDGARAGDVAPGFSVNAAALDPGTAPVAAIAALPVSGPSAGVLLVGLAQKPVCAGCAGGVGVDRALAPGAVIGSVRLRLVPAAGAGPVFGPGALDAIHGFRSAVRRGATGASVGTVAVGTLSGSSPRARRL
jgi:hypothetical protein